MLMGEQRCTLDEKGRLNFPAKFRAEIGEKLYVSRWMDNCLVVLGEADWARLQEQLRAKNVAKGRTLRRSLFGKSAEATPDKQGRILIPAPLREYADLERDVVVVGQDWYAEIWDAERWREMDDELTSDAIIEAMEEIDF